MLRWAVTSCLILSPLFINCAPQSAHPNQYETEQDYTESPEAKPVSSYHEVQTEKTTPNKVLAKPHKLQRVRAQQQHHQQQHQSEQPYQSQEQYQQYQTDYRASTHPPPTQPPASQYEQPQNQYQAQYINQAKYNQQQAVHHEHRPSTTTFIPIIRLEKTQSLDGSYQQSWETGNNIIASENGYLKHIADDQDALVQTGNYSYTAPDGTFVWNSYISDESGFRVVGSHLPTPPPIPEEIQKGLDQIYEGIRLQQEAAAREAKSGKKKPLPEEDNSVGGENYPSSDNYPAQNRYYQKPQQQQPQQYEQQQQQAQVKQQYRQQPQQQYQNQEQQPQTSFRPIVAQPYRRVQKVQRPQSQQYHQPAQHSQQFQESQQTADEQQQSQSEQDEQ